MPDWSVTSWQTKPATHQPEYTDTDQLATVVNRLRNLPPLVTSWEIENLKSLLADAANGHRFVLQGGDCAESLTDCTPDAITGKLKIMLQMGLILTYGGNKPVIRIGRFAGQYAKPRTSPTETRDGQTLPSYFGDLVNRIEFTPEARTPNPQRLLHGYQHAAMTLNFIRALIDGGFADLHHPEYLNLESSCDPNLHRQYHEIVKGISESIEFMESVENTSIEKLTRVEFFTSHEGLNLHYESAGTRTVPRRDGFYNLTTHFPWVGHRTRNLNSAHIEYFKGIQNPIAVKIGPNVEPDELLRLADTLNPKNESGRLTFIHRFGSSHIKKCLPPLLRAIRETTQKVLWICDPMHGNTTTTATGQKTRNMQNILDEINEAFTIHRQEGTILGGVHVELSGDGVTECTGGIREIKENDLASNYQSTCDPRLNYEQSLEISFQIANHLKKQ